MTVAARALLQRALDVRDARRGELEGSVGGYTIFRGESPFGLGDHRVELTFAQHFTERPSISVAPILNPASPVVAGDYPLISHPVVETMTFTRTEGVPRYTGAVVLINVTGPPGTRGTFVWKADGPTNAGSTTAPAED